jgi:hypothetical protein
MIVVADLEELKAYRIDDDPLHSKPRLDLVERFHTGGNQKLQQQATKIAGGSPKNSNSRDLVGGMSPGERHNVELEQRRRCVRALAQRTNSLLKASDIERCFFAASREINNALLDELDYQARAKIEIAVPADLTKINRSDLLGHFKAATRAGALA